MSGEVPRNVFLRRGGDMVKGEEHACACELILPCDIAEQA